MDSFTEASSEDETVLDGVTDATSRRDVETVSLVDSLHSLGNMLRRESAPEPAGVPLTLDLIRMKVPPDHLEEGRIECITSLDIVRSNLTSVAPEVPQQCCDVKIVDLSHNRLTSLPIPKKGWGKCGEMVIDSNNFASLKTLEPLVGLSVLSVCDNRIDLLDPLNKLGNLTVLCLAGNRMTALKGLVLPKLEVLDLSRNRVRKVEACKLPLLVELNLSYNKLTSLEGLGAFSKLTELDVSYNEIEHNPMGSALTPLRLLEHLKVFNANHNKFASLSFLPSLPKLSELLLDCNLLGEGEGGGVESVQSTPRSRTSIVDDVAGADYVTDEEDVGLQSRRGSKVKTVASKNTGLKSSQVKTITSTTSARRRPSGTPSSVATKVSRSSTSAGKKRPVLGTIVVACPALTVLHLSGNAGCVSYSELSALQKCRHLIEVSLNGSVITPPSVDPCATLSHHLNEVYAKGPKTLEVIENYTVSKPNTLNLMDVEVGEEGGRSVTPQSERSVGAGDVNAVPCMQQGSEVTGVTFLRIQRGSFMGGPPQSAWGGGGGGSASNLNSTLTSLSGSFYGRPGTASRPGTAGSARPGTGRPAAKNLSRCDTNRSGRVFATPDEAREGLEEMMARLRHTRHAASSRASKLQEALALLPDDVLEIREAHERVHDVLSSAHTTPPRATSPQSADNAAFLRHVHQRTEAQANPPPKKRQTRKLTTKPLANLVPVGVITQPRGKYHHLQKSEPLDENKRESEPHEKKKVPVRRMSFTEEVEIVKAKKNLDQVIEQRLVSHHESEMRKRAATPSAEDTTSESDSSEDDAAKGTMQSKGTTVSAVQNCIATSTDEASFLSPHAPRHTPTTTTTTTTTSTTETSTEPIPERMAAATTPTTTTTATTTTTTTGNEPHAAHDPQDVGNASTASRLYESDKSIINSMISSLRTAAPLGAQEAIIIEQTHASEVLQIDSDSNGAEYTPGADLTAAAPLSEEEAKSPTGVVVAGGDIRGRIVKQPPPPEVADFKGLRQTRHPQRSPGGPVGAVEAQARKLSNPQPLLKCGGGGGGGGLVKRADSDRQESSGGVCSHTGSLLGEGEAAGSVPSTPGSGVRKQAKRGSLNSKMTRRR